MKNGESAIPEISEREVEKVIDLLKFLSGSNDIKPLLNTIDKLLINNNYEIRRADVDQIDSLAEIISGAFLAPFIAVKNTILNSREINTAIELIQDPERLQKILYSEVFWQKLLESEISLADSEIHTSLITSLAENYENEIVEILSKTLEDNTTNAAYTDRNTLKALVPLVRNIGALKLTPEERVELSSSLSKFMVSLMPQSIPGSKEHELSTVTLFQSLSELAQNKGLSPLFTPETIEETSRQIASLISQSIVLPDKDIDKINNKIESFIAEISRKDYDEETKQYLGSILSANSHELANPLERIKQKKIILENNLKKIKKEKEEIAKDIEAKKKEIRNTESKAPKSVMSRFVNLFSFNSTELAENLVISTSGLEQRLQLIDESIESQTQELKKQNKLLKDLTQDIKTAKDLRSKASKSKKVYKNIEAVQKAYTEISESAVSSIFIDPEKKAVLVEAADIALGIWENTIAPNEGKEYDYRKLVINSTDLLAHLSGQENFTETAARSLDTISQNLDSHDGQVITKLTSIFFEACTRNKQKQLASEEIKEIGIEIGDGLDHNIHTNSLSENLDTSNKLSLQKYLDKIYTLKSSRSPDQYIEKELQLLKENLEEVESASIFTKIYTYPGIVNRGLNLSHIILSQFKEEELEKYADQINLREYIKEKMVENILAQKIETYNKAKENSIETISNALNGHTNKKKSLVDEETINIFSEKFDLNEENIEKVKKAIRIATIAENSVYNDEQKEVFKEAIEALNKASIQEEKIKKAAEKAIENSKILDQLASYAENSRKGNQIYALYSLSSAVMGYFYHIPKEVDKQIEVPKKEKWIDSIFSKRSAKNVQGRYI